MGTMVKRCEWTCISTILNCAVGKMCRRYKMMILYRKIAVNLSLLACITRIVHLVLRWSVSVMLTHWNHWGWFRYSTQKTFIYYFKKIVLLVTYSISLYRAKIQAQEEGCLTTCMAWRTPASDSWLRVQFP